MSEWQDKTMDAVFAELKAAEIKFPGWPDDVVHAAAIVSEEAGELQKAALDYYYHECSEEQLVKEAAQTAAMGIRFLINYFKNGY